MNMIPPTPEQLNLGVHSPIMLFTIRVMSFVLLFIAIHLFSRALKIRAIKYYWIFVSMSPVLFLISMCYPTDVVKIFIVSLAFYFLTRRKRDLLTAIIVTSVLVVVINVFIIKTNSKIPDFLSLSKSQQEVTFRFNVEDNLKPNIYFPTIVKRIVYNKYYTVYKNFAAETMRFFDPETLFFQEVHPTSQKAFVMFFWPEIFIFISGIWLLAIKKIRITKGIYGLLFLSYIYFLTSSATSDRRLILTIFPLAVIFAETFNYVSNTRQKLVKAAFFGVFFISLYGLATFYFDLSIRPDFWLDNKPLAYDYVFKYLKNNNLIDKKIIFAETLFWARDYCPYYLNNCNQIIISDFNLNKDSPNKNTLYIGFIGNFLGRDREDVTVDDVNSSIGSLRLKVYSSKHILNNIVSGYGQELIITGPI